MGLKAPAYTAWQGGTASGPGPGRHSASMANTTTSVGRGPASGGNENHDGDPTRTTLGETAAQEPPAGRDAVDGAPDMPAGVPGGEAHPAIRRGPQSWPDGPNVEDSPWELDAARGVLPPQGPRPGGQDGSGRQDEDGDGGRGPGRQPGE